MKIQTFAIAILLLAFFSLGASAAEYGQPYGSTDESPMETSDVQSIHEVNDEVKSPDSENEEPLIEQDDETPMEASDGETPYKEQ